MIIERSREHLINFGDFNNTRIGARLVLDSSDPLVEKLLKQSGGTLNQLADDLLDDALSHDVESAINCVPEDENIYLEYWKTEE